MAYVTTTAVTSTSTSSKDVIFDNSLQPQEGPLEWTITVDGAVDIYFTGAFPGKDVKVEYATGTYTYGTPGRGISKIEGVVASGSTNVTIRPSVG